MDVFSCNYLDIFPLVTASSGFPFPRNHNLPCIILMIIYVWMVSLHGIEERRQDRNLYPREGVQISNFCLNGSVCFEILFNKINPSTLRQFPSSLSMSLCSFVFFKKSLVLCALFNSCNGFNLKTPTHTRSARAKVPTIGKYPSVQPFGGLSLLLNRLRYVVRANFHSSL